MRKELWSDDAWADYLWWKSKDKDIAKKIDALLDDIQRDPFAGLGNPKPLKANWRGYWSRKITQEHRLVYRVTVESIYIELCRGHYE